MMPHRQTIEFLRRRYAAAILRDDAETACRLRACLDGMMNRPEGAPFAGDQFTEVPAPTPDRSAPRLRLVTPVTGLLEWPGRASR